MSDNCTAHCLSNCLLHDLVYCGTSSLIKYIIENISVALFDYFLFEIIFTLSGKTGLLLIILTCHFLTCSWFMFLQIFFIHVADEIWMDYFQSAWFNVWNSGGAGMTKKRCTDLITDLALLQ